MLDQFRSSIGSLWAKILLTFLVLSFGIWGIGDVVTHGARDAAVAKVGSKAITISDFQRSIQMEGERLRRIMGEDFNQAMLKNPIVVRSTLQRLINQSLLTQEAETMGLIPSDADVVRLIRGNPVYQDSSGNFDKGIFQGMLQRANISEKTYIEGLRSEIGLNLLVETMTANVPVSDTAAKVLLEAREEGRNMTLYALKPSMIGNVPAPGEEQIKAYYESHSREFTAPEYRTVSYVTLSADNVKPESGDTDLQALYKERMDDFRHPERRKVEQLLYSSEEDARKASDMLKSGKSFEQVAKETNVMNKNSVSLGKVEKNAVLEAAADKVFSLPAGGVTEPIQSPFGWHIFHVSEVEPPSVSTLEEVRPQLEKEAAQRGIDAALNKLANQLQDTLAGGTPLQDAAKEAGLKVMTVGPVDHQGKTLENAPSKEIPDLEKFLEVAFKTDEKTESPLTSSKNGVSYVLRVDKVIPERLRTLDEVRGLVVAGWQKEERDKRLSELADTIGGQFAKADERAAAIEKYHLQPVMTTQIKRGSHTAGDISLPPQLVNDVFMSKPQQGTKAYRGRNGEYLLAVLNNIAPAAMSDKDPKIVSELADIHDRLKKTGETEILHQYTQYLSGKYPVTVNDTVLQAVLK